MENEITNLISTVGFPIVMSLILLYQNHENNKKHEEETKGFMTSIDNNTRVLEKLLMKMEEKEDESVH